jgi:hypothetical protein
MRKFHEDKQIALFFFEQGRIIVQNPWMRVSPETAISLG